MFIKEFLQIIDDTVDKNATLQEVIDKMTDQRLHHIVILDQKKPIGIITERDVVNFFSKKVNFTSYAIDFATKEIIQLHHTRMVEYALTMMLNNNIRKLIVVDTNDEYLGCIEQEELIYALEEKIQRKDVKLHQLTHQGNKAVLINENSSLSYALEIMTENKLMSLLVTSDDKAVGIITESDILQLAKKNIDQNELVKYFMHSPIVLIEEYKTADDMITLMHKQKIRRVVVHNSQDDQYYTLCSADIASIIKGNYTKFLETRFYDSRDTFNALSEYVIELIDVQDEQVIFWTNSVTKANFNIQLDDNITKLIPKDTWEPILEKLYNEHILFDIVKIKEKYYQIKGHYGSMMNDAIIKIFLNDVTQIVNLTEKLKEENKIKDQLLFDQAKMVQMGEMIGNIAHQWRQPLSVISSVASGIQVKQEFNILDDTFLNESLDDIQRSAQFLSKTIDTFRDFIKEDKIYKEVILQDRVNKALSIVQTSLKNNFIEFSTNIDSIEPIPLKLVLGELSQVIINIINNAKDAILENGIEDPWIQLNLEKTPNLAIITIEDNGGGIREDVMPNIFDMHFTTKHHSHGTGLGLYMSKKIITESLNGNLYASNTKDGAKFVIELKI